MTPAIPLDIDSTQTTGDYPIMDSNGNNEAFSKLPWWPQTDTKINPLRRGNNGRYLSEDIFQCIFINEKFCVLILILMTIFIRIQQTPSQDDSGYDLMLNRIETVISYSTMKGKITNAYCIRKIVYIASHCLNRTIGQIDMIFIYIFVWLIQGFFCAWAQSMRHCKQHWGCVQDQHPMVLVWNL